MRIGWISVALLAFSRYAAAEDVTAYVTMKGVAGTDAAKRIASSLLQKAGVSIAWTPKPPAAGAPRIWVRIELAEGTPDERLPGALAVSYPYGGCSRSITVFFDRVRMLARGVDRESAAQEPARVRAPRSGFQTVHAASTSRARSAAFPLPRNSPREIGTATLSIRVKSRNPTAKIPAATRNSVMVG
jgi:hypothetical protein